MHRVLPLLRAALGCGMLAALPAAPVAAQPNFLRHDIATGLAGPWGLAVADLDGDLDVAAVALDVGAVAWWENQLVVAAEPGPPASAALLPSHPNPFRDRTAIPFRLAAAGEVELTVHDALGRHVATLLRGRRPAGLHEAVWDGADAAGRPVAAGPYVYRLATGGAHQTGRLTRLR
jgi:hypothetical protein